MSASAMRLCVIKAFVWQRQRYPNKPVDLQRVLSECDAMTREQLVASIIEDLSEARAKALLAFAVMLALVEEGGHTPGDAAKRLEVDAPEHEVAAMLDIARYFVEQMIGGHEPEAACRLTCALYSDAIDDLLLNRFARCLGMPAEPFVMPATSRH